MSTQANPSKAQSQAQSQAPSPSLSRLTTILSLANFAIGMGAFVVIGILTPIADAFAMTKAEAGWVLTAYAISYAILSPLGVALSGSFSRRSVLIAGLSLFAIAMAASALSQTANQLFAARSLAALGAGLFTPVAASVAFSLAAPEARGKALASVFFGLTLAQALGVPAGAWLGYTFGWQSAFAVVVVLTLIALVMVVMTVPKQIPFQVNTLATLGAALSDWRSVLSVLFTATFLGAIYVLYTYFAPFLETRLGFGRDGISLFLFLFGIGAVIGNILGGKLTDSIGPANTLMTLCAAQIVLLACLSLLPLNTILAGVLTLTWSVFGWSFMVAQQARLVRQTPSRQAVVLALNSAAIYVGAVVGSWAGGKVLEAQGPAVLGLAASAAMLVALVHLLVSERVPPRA
jgi:MFS transporter, DHA1 family, inner membrane transport protein